MKNLFISTCFVIVFLIACTPLAATKSTSSKITLTPPIIYTLQPTVAPIFTPGKTLNHATTATVVPPSLGQIAFVSSHKGKYAVYTINADGTALTKLTDDMTVVMNPHWSPKGKQIMFSACLEGEGECSGAFDIFIMNDDGSKLVNVTNDPAEDMQPSWSPDGTRFVFSSDRSGNFEIYSMAVDGTHLLQLTNSTTANTNPQWSSDGSWIAYESQRILDNGGWYYEICVVSSDGTKTLQLAEGVMPYWSPDSKFIAFNSNDIFVIKPDGTGLKNLSNSKFDEFDFSWSPDSKFIAFVTNRDSNAEIYTVCIDCEKNPQVNISNSPANDQHPSWSPDGTKIVFLSDESVCVMNVDGSQKECFNIKALGTVDWKP